MNSNGKAADNEGPKAMDLLRTIDARSDEASEARWRELARDLLGASSGYRFAVAPNPNVGAAVLSDGVEIGRGYHELWGGPHAEVRALEAAAASGIDRASWDTLVVTLEPCSSQGKTPPCIEAILAAGIRRVVVGALDPDPRHRGRGLALLQEAGLDVHVLSGLPRLQEACPHFFRWTHPDRLRRPRPWTIAKWAQTRTGQLTPPADAGDGRWISGPVALTEVQHLRSRVDAIVTGIGTVLADDPRLTVRPPASSTHPPLRVVLDSELRTPPDCRLLAPAASLAPGETAGRTIVLARRGASAVRHRALEAAGAEVHGLRPAGDGRVSLVAAMEWLWARDVRRVLLEAGPTLLERAFEKELVDQVSVYSGNINGGRGRSLAHYLDRRRLTQMAHREVGEDSILEAFVARP